jgi:hypothetical protein
VCVCVCVCVCETCVCVCVCVYVRRVYSRPTRATNRVWYSSFDLSNLCHEYSHEDTSFRRPNVNNSLKTGDPVCTGIWAIFAETQFKTFPNTPKVIIPLLTTNSETHT